LIAPTAVTYSYHHDILKMRTRLKELEGLVAEKEKLERAIQLLEEHDLGESSPNLNKRVPAEIRKAEIRAVVSERPGIRVGEVAELLGLTSQRVVQLANAMADEGELRRKPGGGLLVTRG
jgi:hypothetical protein